VGNLLETRSPRLGKIRTREENPPVGSWSIRVDGQNRAGLVDGCVGKDHALLVVGAMNSLLATVLALLLAVTPTVDMVCRAVCTPQLTGAPAQSCHEVAFPTVDGVLLPVAACQRDAAATLAPADAARNLVVPAPLIPVQVMASPFVSASSGADLRRQVLRPRSHGYASTTVLRI
jgi:hypothetical protein